MTTSRTLLGRIALLCAAAATALTSTAAVTSVTVFASANIAAGATRCTVSARAPRLDTATRTLRGTAAVTCTVATVIGLETSVIELDGTVESGVAVAKETRWVVVNAGSTTVVMTARGKCINTEPGNEEFATKARVLLGASVSVWDRTVPDPDSFAC
jgi:hypothetical protein